MAIAALLVWPRYIDRGVSAATPALPTMAPVNPDYLQRDKLVAVWERSYRQHLPGDMISPRMLADQYLQRYREQMDVDDVLRAKAAADASMRAQPRGNMGAALEIATVFLTLHRFHDAIDMTHWIESWDPGDDAMYPREASLDMEIGDFATAKRRLDAVPPKDRSDAWSVIESRYLELTGRLPEARALLARAAAYQNAAFDAPAQSRAWYFFRQGEMAFEAGDNDAAIADEREALVVFPHYADAFRAAARFECALHAWQACLADAKAAADIVPYPESLGYEADAQLALGDPASAAQTRDLIRTIARLGDAQHITDRLVAIYYADHQLYPGDAYAIAKNELNARRDLFTWDTLAWAAAMDGRWDEARSAIARALAQHAQNSLIDYHAGVIAAHFGDRTAADGYFQTALSLNPHFHPTFADDARAYLAGR
jgi:tetratricopeptide (TPR) repeat protein